MFCNEILLWPDVHSNGFIIKNMQEADKNQNGTLLFMMSEGCLQEKKSFMGVKLQKSEVHH